MTKKRRVPLVIICVLGLVVLVFAGLTVKNRFGAEFDRLDEADQAVLSEYNALCTSLEADDVWDGFDLQGKTVLAMAGDWGESYLINPVEPVDSIFATAVALPDDWDISVYRISLAAPDLLAFRFEGNFNTTGEAYSLFGNQLHFVKYDRGTSVFQQWTSDHFATFWPMRRFTTICRTTGRTAGASPLKA